MSKTTRKIKKSNHGKRPSCAQARRAKRRLVKT
ncbi:MAG: 50S ribosomal protein bL37 [Thermoguttaceae bacterium]